MLRIHVTVSINIAKLDQACLQEWAEGTNSWLSVFAGTWSQLWLHGGVQQEGNEEDMDSNTLSSTGGEVEGCISVILLVNIFSVLLEYSTPLLPNCICKLFISYN